MLGEIDAPTLGGLLEGEGFQCRACKAENSGVELQTTYCYGALFLKELGAMNIGVNHAIKQDAELKAGGGRGNVQMEPKRIMELDDLFSRK